jgi:predicted alpha/beta hydrolase
MSSRELFGLGSDHPRAELREWESWAKDVLIFKLVRSEKDLTNPVS